MPNSPSSSERYALIQTLNTLPLSIFEELCYTLKVPPYILPSTMAPLGLRTKELLDWAESPAGCGLQEVKNILAQILPARLESSFQPELLAIQSVEIELNSDKGIDYHKLRTLLSQQNWRDSHDLTGFIIAEIIDPGYRMIRGPEDIRRFPCTDLRTIEQLWLKYSQGKFGFSVQKQIWDRYNSPIEYNSDFKKFADRIGWRVNNEWIVEHSFQRSYLPQGYLPMWGGISIQHVARLPKILGVIFERVEACGLTAI